MTISERGDSRVRPLVTVVMPTYNRAEMVAQAVASIVAQTYSHWELLVVDDGSTDGTRERLEELAEPRLRVINCTHGATVSRLRNIGVAAGTGEYVAFLDSDDLWLPHRLEIQLAALGGSESNWSYGDINHIDWRGSPIPQPSGRFQPISGRIAKPLLLDQTGACILTWLVPRGLFNEVGGFDESLLSHGDLDLAIRLGEVADAIAVPEVLAVVREHEGRMTSARPHPHERAATIFKKVREQSGDPALANLARRRWTGHLASASGDRLAAGEWVKASALLWRAVVHGANPALCLRSLSSGLGRLARRRR